MRWPFAPLCLFFLGLAVMVNSACSSAVDRTSTELGRSPPVGTADKHQYAPVPSQSVHYRFRPSPDWATLDVEVCRPSGAPPELAPQVDWAESLLVSQSTLGSCAVYQLDFTRQLEGRPLADPVRQGDDLLLSPDVWLFAVTPLPQGRITASFELSAAQTIAVPWTSEGDHYVIPASAFAWRGQAALGGFETQELSIDDSRLVVSTLGPGFSHPQAVTSWIQASARATLTLYRRFPVERLQILLVPVDRAKPRSFGTVMRGGGSSITIYVDRHADQKQLQPDWTAVHEFLHLGLPKIQMTDAWLYEGLAQYYTTIVRARAGWLSNAEAFAELGDGFRRGAESPHDLSLEEDSRHMHERASYYRVYWSGAAIALTADIKGRQQRGTSLDQAMRALMRCCATSPREFTAAEIMAHIDASFGAAIFAPLAQSVLPSDDFPDLAMARRRLGIEVSPPNQWTLKPDPEASAFRTALLTPIEAAER